MNNENICSKIWWFFELHPLLNVDLLFIDYFGFHPIYDQTQGFGVGFHIIETFMTIGYSSHFFIDSIKFKHAFIKFPLMKIKIWIFFEENDCLQNKVKRRMALMVVNVELQSVKRIGWNWVFTIPRWKNYGRRGLWI
jgi:hypothetical protein